MYVVTASLFDRCPRCGRNLDRVSLLRDDFCPRCGAPLCEEERPARTTETACAKVNLTLSVGEKRPDGYHEVETAMTGVGLYDTVALYRNTGPWDRLECDPPVTERAGDNLCMKALRVFFEEFGPKKDFVTIQLEKRIPTQAGLGGGSSDAAAVLRGLRTLYAPQHDRHAAGKNGRRSWAAMCRSSSGAVRRWRQGGAKSWKRCPRCPNAGW